MFRKSSARGPAGRSGEDGRGGVCPKCGGLDVMGDSCPRCRVRVSTYRLYLASLGREAPDPRGGASRRTWLKRLFMVAPSGPAAPSRDRRSSYEELILGRIYRELRYPATTRGVYIVLLGFHVVTTGRLGGLRLLVYPPNAEVAASVRVAINRAEPFPLPPAEEGGPDQRFSLALTVSI